MKALETLADRRRIRRRSCGRARRRGVRRARRRSRSALSASWTFPFSVRRSMRSARPPEPSLLHMPPQLQLRDIRLTLGGAPLLEGAELSISPGDRIALVGRNGSGKSTLLKIAAGESQADGGTRFAQPNARLRYLPQEPDLTGYATTLDFVLERPRRGGQSLSRAGADGRPRRRSARRSGATLRRRSAPRGARPRPRPRSRHSAARRADQPSRPRRDRMAGEGIGGLARGLRGDQPRPAAARRPHPRDGLARSRPHAPARPGLRRLRGVARRHARGRGNRAPQARSAHRRGRALDALRRHRAAQAQHAPGRRTGGAAARAARGAPRVRASRR